MIENSNLSTLADSVSAAGIDTATFGSNSESLLDSTIGQILSNSTPTETALSEPTVTDGVLAEPSVTDALNASPTLADQLAANGDEPVLLAAASLSELLNGIGGRANPPAPAEPVQTAPAPAQTAPEPVPPIATPPAVVPTQPVNADADLVPNTVKLDNTSQTGGVQAPPDASTRQFLGAAEGIEALNNPGTRVQYQGEWVVESSLTPEQLASADRGLLSPTDPLGAFSLNDAYDVKVFREADGTYTAEVYTQMEFRFSDTTAGAWTAETQSQFIADFESRVQDIWDGVTIGQIDGQDVVLDVNIDSRTGNSPDRNWTTRVIVVDQPNFRSGVRPDTGTVQLDSFDNRLDSRTQFGGPLDSPQTTSAHEFGHVLGVLDEYVSGANPEHRLDGDSVMNRGNVVRDHHTAHIFEVAKTIVGAN